MLIPQPLIDQYLLKETVKKSLTPLPSKRVLAKVNLGSPSKNCLGVGICKIDFLSFHEQERIPLSKCSTIAILEKHTGDRLSMHFSKDSLSTCARETHFHNHTFIVEENYTLSSSLVKRLDCQQIIYKGFYPVTETANFLTILF